MTAVTSVTAVGGRSHGPSVAIECAVARVGRLVGLCPGSRRNLARVLPEDGGGGCLVSRQLERIIARVVLAIVLATVSMVELVRQESASRPP